MLSRCVLLSGVVIFLYALSRSSAPVDGAQVLAGVREWAPSHALVVASVGDEGPGTLGDARHRRFMHMVQGRYREHDLPVGVNFVAARKVKLMCGCLMPRWNMAKVAGDVFDDAEATFGRPCTVEIFETAMCSQKRKLGEVTRADDGRLKITFASNVVRMRHFPRPLMSPLQARLL